MKQARRHAGTQARVEVSSGSAVERAFGCRREMNGGDGRKGAPGNTGEELGRGGIGIRTVEGDGETGRNLKATVQPEHEPSTRGCRGYAIRTLDRRCLLVDIGYHGGSGWNMTKTGRPATKGKSHGSQWRCGGCSIGNRKCNKMGEARPVRS